MNGNRGGMSPRDRYYADMRAAEAARQEQQRRAAEAQRKRAEAERRRLEAERAERARQRERMRRRQARRLFLHRFGVFLLCFVIIFAVVAAGVFISFHMRRVRTDGVDEYKFVYGTGDGAVTARVKASMLDRGGVRYVNFTELSEFLQMKLMGGGSTYRFIIDGSGEEAVFTDGAADAEVNGVQQRLAAPAVFDGDDVWVPMSFVERSMTGVSISVDDDKSTITFSVTGTVAFAAKRVDPAPSITEDTGIGSVNPDAPVGGDPADDTPTPEFISDLSEYESYMNPTGADRDAYLILVNAWNKIGEDYVPDDLVDLVNTRGDRKAQQMRKQAAMALEAMFIELYANGYDKKGPSGYPVTVMSGYRSYTNQVSLFNSYVDREMRDDPSLTRAQAEDITATYSARPGTSEHQTGLCIDMHNLSSAQRSFADQEAFLWLRDNAWKFGFVLRFPEDKQEITGITFEPWHYRYVGRYHAYRMWKTGMCLEEYVETL